MPISSSFLLGDSSMLGLHSSHICILRGTKKCEQQRRKKTLFSFHGMGLVEMTQTENGCDYDAVCTKPILLGMQEMQGLCCDV